MKKMKKFLVMAMAALAFTACSNDDIVIDEGGGNGNGKEIKGDAWIALNLKTTTAGFQGANSRAVNNPPQLTGTPNESTISQVDILLFNAAKKLVKRIDLTAIGGAGIPGQPEGLSGAAFKIPKTSLYMLVVANPPAGFGAAFNEDDTGNTGSDYDVVNAAISSTVADVTTQSSTQNYFMMTNAKGDLEPSDDNGNLKSIPVHSSAEAAQAAPLAIYIDRVVAKVRVTKTLSNGVGDPVVGDVEWLLNVTNKKYFPASKRILTHREVVPSFSDWVWSDRYHIGSYRQDPNYDSTNPDAVWINGTAPASQTNYNLNYNYYHEGNTPGAGSWNASDLTASEYCLENTQLAVDNVHAYTTQVLVKAQFAPSSFRKWTLTGDTWASSDDNNATASIDWLKISSGNYTFASFKTWVEKELWSKYKDGNPDNYETPMTNAFNKYLNDIGASANKLTIPDAAGFQALTGSDFDEKYATLLSNLGTEYTAAQAAIVAAGSGVKGVMTFYKGGINYYKIMIKHDDSTANLNALGEFGVVRNAVYDVNITRIINSGYPVIPNPDPDTDDEDDEQWLSIQINVNPWTWYKQDAPL